MNPLQRTLIEKTGHDFGFEYTVVETPASLTLGSARHPLHAQVMLIQNEYQLHLINAKPLLINELGRDFSVTGKTITCDNIEQLSIVLRRAASLAHALPNQAEHDFESALEAAFKKLPKEIKNTEVERMVRQRVGQDTFRKAMLDYWGGACAVTGVALPEVLRASHALPWAECACDAERLDVFNGFLLTANLDALFDRFLISFDATGGILISDLISESDREFLGITSCLKLRWLTDQHDKYLDLHRARLQVA
ncbi:HNH endonuclease [Microbulbifer sp. SA54]|uniref:HNH endonuclease n=1 Tax=Microbulbifer sp. SA54 TaxID=3401577 RepID=UPI003AAD7956